VFPIVQTLVSLSHQHSYFISRLAGCAAFLFFLLLPGFISAQCSSVTPVYTLNLTSSASASATTPSASRNGTCCGGVDPCVKIVVQLNPGAMGLVLFPQGADPGGPLYYEENCSGNPILAGTSVCVSGVNTTTLTVCKIGNNANSYIVASIPRPGVTSSLNIRVGCSQSVSATGFSVSTISWTAINSGSNTSAYNGFLSCTSGCSVTTVTPSGSPPAYVDYEVSGYGQAPCDAVLFRDTVRVYFYNALLASLSSTSACNGNTVALTPAVSGGKTPYTYSWSTGSTASSVSAGPGNYTVTINDATGCAPVMSTVTVSNYTLQIQVNAGIDLTVCASSSSVTLNGWVMNASAAVWSGGNGTFVPSATVLATGYIPSTSELINGAQLYLTTTGNYGCAAKKDTVNLAFQRQAAINAGPDFTVCATNNILNLSASITNYSLATALWSSSGTGTFSSPAASVTTYSASTADKNAGSVSIVVTTTNNGVCAPATDTVQVVISPAPTVAIAPSHTICSTASTVFLYGNVTGVTGSGQWATNGSGIFANSSSTATTYSLGVTDLVNGTVSFTLTSTNNGVCAAASNTMLVTISKSATVSAGQNLNVCSGQSLVALNGTLVSPSGTGIWTSNGSGAFVPTSTNIAASYSITAADISAGFVTFTLSSTNNGPCASVSDTMMMRLTIQPTVTISGSNTICAGGTATIIAAGATSYSWSIGATTATINVAPAVTMVYTVQGINSVCADTRTVLLTVNKMPTVTALSSHSSVCAGQSATLTASGAGTYTWLPMNINSVSVTVTPSVGSVYSLWGNNPQCPDDSVTVNLKVFPLPSVSITASPTLACEGDIVMLLASGASTYSWSTGGTGITASVTANFTTTYSVTGVDSNSCSATASITLNVEKCLGITDPEIESSAYVYPNPSRDAFTIHAAVNGSFIISDTDGRAIRTVRLSANQPVQVSGLPAGIYLISDTSGAMRKKIVVMN
jgi:hypothetical protein